MQDGLSVPGKTSQAKTLQRGIEYERSSGLKNLLGAKIHFGAFLVSSHNSVLYGDDAWRLHNAASQQTVRSSERCDCSGGSAAAAE